MLSILREVNWEEYLQYQAVNILSDRPNNPRGCYIINSIRIYII